MAFSGGVDSTALLLSLYYLTPRLNLTLVTAHLNHGLRTRSGIKRRHAQPMRGPVRGMPVAFMREKHNGGLKSGQLLGHFIHGHHTGGERWEQAQPETELITGGAEFTLAFRTPFGSTAQRDRQHPNFERAFFAQPQRE